MKTRTLTSLLALAAATLTPLAAHATGEVEVSTTGKGIVGGALMGAELVMVTEAAFGVKPTWAYVVGGLAGGAAGGVGGYFVDQQDSPRASMLMLAGGLVFAIPTVVAVLSATSYEPPQAYLQDQPPIDEPVAEPPAPTDAAPPPPAPAPPASEPVSEPPVTAPPPADAAAPAAPAPSTRRYLRSERRLSLQLPPPALIGVKDARVALGVPNVELRQAYTRTERLVFGAPDATEVRIPVIDVTF